MDFNPYENNMDGRKIYSPVYGTITAMEPVQGNGCSQIVTLEDEEGQQVRFMLTAETYVVDFVTFYEGEQVIMFYDPALPMPLVYPPLYQAVIAARNVPGVYISAGYFDRALYNADRTLKLNMAPSTQVVTSNNQRFWGSVARHNLIVLYGSATRSIPAQTIPDKVIVMCRT